LDAYESWDVVEVEREEDEEEEEEEVESSMIIVNGRIYLNF